MPFHDLFSAGASGYAAARPTYPAALFDWVGAAAPSRARVWDVASGNGQAAVGLAGVFEVVAATDASAAQIAAARRHPHVAYSVQLAEAPAFADRAFDAVTVAAALHWFDADTFFRGVARVLRPRGLFAAWTYHRFEVTPEIDRAIADTLLARIQLSWSPLIQSSWDGYRDVPMPFPRVTAPVFHIECEWTMDAFVAFVRTWSGFRAYCAVHGEAWFDDAVRVIGAAWGDGARSVVLPIDVLAGRRG